jgi:hypothetical protein
MSLGVNDLYKIGQTYDPANRLKALQASNPKLKYVWSAMVDDSIGAEKAIHERYKPCKIEREIFKLNRIDFKGLEKLVNRFRNKQLFGVEEADAEHL